jgi:exportin-5
MYKVIFNTHQVLGQMLVFLTSALRMRDTRACASTITTLTRILPHFRGAGPVHDYFCDDVLKAAITSFNEPHFVDCQRQLASLIALIITLDEHAPRDVILSLPGLGDRVDKVDRFLARVRDAGNAARGGAVVQELLSGLRGVSIHELGKMEQPKAKKQVSKSDAMAGNEMAIDDNTIQRGGEEELAGVAELMGQ